MGPSFTPRGTYLCPGRRDGPPGRLPGRVSPGGGIPAPGPTPNGRDPAGATRVGCIGRRSPGRNGGRADPGAWGRAVRWKIGWPGTGRPGTGREIELGAGAAGGASGALYTGRGPVCGMIIRGGGAIG